ncbi:MAG: hypothetical protein ACEY3L_21255, partial [Wolbachia sp.]
MSPVIPALFSVIQVVDNIETKNFLDKLRQPPYHETEAIYLSSQSVQVNDKKLRVFGVSCLIFR